MVIIAASAGAAIYFYFGVSVSEAATIAVATLTALALYNTLSNRIGVGIGAWQGRAQHRIGAARPRFCQRQGRTDDRGRKRVTSTER
jgi:hypothetical protein